MKRVLLAAMLLAVGACRKTAAPVPPDATSAAAVPTMLDGGANGEADAHDPVEDGPYAELPPREAVDPSLDLSDRVLGFSSDDRSLGFETSTCEGCPWELRFTGRDGAALGKPAATLAGAGRARERTRVSCEGHFRIRTSSSRRGPRTARTT